MSDPEGPRRLHPLSPLLSGARMVPSLVLALVLGAGGDLSLIRLLVIVAVLTAAARYLSWSRHTYAIEGRDLVVESGLLQRNRRVVPLERVQQVDLQRKVLHQALGLAAVRIDTAGAGREAEVVLDAVSNEEADRLRALLGPRPAGAAAPVGATPPALPTDHPEAAWGARPGWPPAPPPVPVQGPVGVGSGTGGPEREVVVLGTGLLALGGITGKRLGVMLAVVGSLAGFVLDVAPDAVDQSIDAARTTRPTVTTLVLIAVATLPLWLGAAAASAVLTDGGFRLSRRGDHLHVRRGLLDQRESNLPIHRVQVVRVRQNPLRRALGLVSVTLQSAGGSAGVEGDPAHVTVPVLRVGDLPLLLGEVLPVDPSTGPLRPAPAAARRRAWVRHLVPTLVVVVTAWVVGLLVASPSGVVGSAAAAATVVVLALVATSAELSYAGLGWAASPDLVATRRGGWSRETALVPVAKAQSTRLATSPFQRRVGLASLAIEVAGRGATPTVVDGDAETLVGLRLRALDSVAARLDEAAVRRRAADAAGAQLT